ncbi:MAG: glycosyltransferase family 39 protein [Bacteroidales bacterium]|nr:glycosyltransferase family 39 protein [Bacteroidales bacterium]
MPLLLILLISLIINLRHLNEPPAYIHAWTQADNYSLAMGFLHNGGDLFHPQTLIFNKQQKGFDDPESLVTACDFPLHHWFVAMLMSVTGSYQPWVFRGLTMAVSILGLWALYFLALLLTHSRAKSLLVSIVMATAPSYAYYSVSFLPTVPALSLAMGGLLFYVLHLRDGKIWMLWVSLLLLSLSMMYRTSFAVLWVAVACFQMLRFMRHEAEWRSWLPFVAGAALYVLWWLWSYHLRQQYGSLFLSSLLPVHSREDACYVFQNMHDRWRFHYFQRMQHWLYVVVAIAAVITLFVRREKISTSRNKLSLWWLLAIWLSGEVLFAIAMFQQFCDHDYYFLDSFFLPIVMLLVGLMSIIHNPSKLWSRIVLLSLVLALAGVMTAKSCEMQKVRRLEGVESLQTAVRYKNANRWLEESGYGSKELRFLTLFSYPQNTPFVMMNREGYAVMWTNPEIVAHALTFDYDYILVEDEVYRKEFENAPQVLSRLQRLASNGEISVCVLSDSVLHPVPEDFFK